MIRALLSYLPPCLFHALTGFYCPGCGGTRAFLALLDGHILQSLYYHPLVIYTVICFLWYMGAVFIKKISGKKMQYYVPPINIALILGGVLTAIHCLAHNLLYLLGVPM